MIKLNVGAGRYHLIGYESVDLFHPKADIKAPAWDLPYGDNTINDIYCSHMMEHLQGEELKWTLKEFSRVIKPLGILEIITPDLMKAIKYWLNSNYTNRWGHAMDRIFGHQRKDGDVHYTGFTSERWQRLLPQYGFKVLKVRNQPSRFDNPNRHIRNTDLYVKAEKI